MRTPKKTPTFAIISRMVIGIALIIFAPKITEQYESLETVRGKGARIGMAIYKQLGHQGFTLLFVAMGVLLVIWAVYAIFQNKKDK